MFAGLADLASALQGGRDQDDEEYEDGEDEGGEGDQDQEEDGDAVEDEGEQAGGSAAAPALRSFWGVASVLTATVKAKTAEVLTAVKETDWRAELEAFQQGAKEDAEAVGKGADVVLHKAVAAAEQLPTALEHLPGTAGAALPGLQARAEKAAGVAKEQAGRGLAGLAGLGSKIVLGTHDLFEQINNAVQNEMALAEGGGADPRRAASAKSLGGTSGRYSRFDADVAAMQRDSGTYCDEPEDEDDFGTWLAGFDLEARRPDIERLIAENTFMSELQARIVPLIVEYEAFWTRYFYRLHKLEQKHAQFVQLTQRAAAAQQEEELGWSDEEEEQGGSSGSGSSPGAAAAGEQAQETPSSSSTAEEAPLEASDEEEPAAEVPVGAEEPAAATVAAAAAAEAARPASSSDDSSPAVTTLSSAEAAPTGSKPAATAAAATKVAAPAAAATPETTAAAAPAAAEVDDDQLSDWGEEDEAALEAATAAAGGCGGGGGEGADAEESWGSDWE
ncbi:BSD domain-containing 1 [Micractinium conductrix]|uniref:BSD domain-containing 1 n=1 Tax=Micractinium conductrix TaxID=554055 RepID=A0A2P6VJK6_9CHLO|nr:BSD domain-containing 1 [Micractinium conductrix]|eukprot:PSC74272.1 BSD domain-containing 1 [Micractinium conductrix]